MSRTPWRRKLERCAKHPVQPRLSKVSVEVFVMIKVMTADEPRASGIVLKHAPHAQKRCCTQRSFPIDACRKRNEKSKALHDTFPSALVKRVLPDGKSIFVMSFVHPVKRRGVQGNVGREKPNIVRKHVSQCSPHFASQLANMDTRRGQDDSKSALDVTRSLRIKLSRAWRRRWTRFRCVRCASVSCLSAHSNCKAETLVGKPCTAKTGDQDRVPRAAETADVVYCAPPASSSLCCRRRRVRSVVAPTYVFSPWPN